MRGHTEGEKEYNQEKSMKDCKKVPVDSQQYIVPFEARPPQMRLILFPKFGSVV